MELCQNIRRVSNDPAGICVYVPFIFYYLYFREFGHSFAGQITVAAVVLRAPAARVSGKIFSSRSYSSFLIPGTFLSSQVTSVPVMHASKTHTSVPGNTPSALRKKDPAGFVSARIIC